MPHWTIFPHLRAQWGAVMDRWIWLQHQMHFHATLLIMVIEIWFNFKIVCNMAKKPFLKSLVISVEILSKFGILKGRYQNVWKQWGLSGLISVTRLGLAAWPGVERNFWSAHPPQLNCVGSGVVWVMGLFSLCWHYSWALLIYADQSTASCWFPGARPSATTMLTWLRLWCNMDILRGVYIALQPLNKLRLRLVRRSSTCQFLCYRCVHFLTGIRLYIPSNL